MLERHDRGEDISKLPWGNHPTVRMWIGYTYSLKLYYNEIVKEWIRRGFKNNMNLYPYMKCIWEHPSWFGREDFHDAHKSNLLRKDKKYYSLFGWKVPDNLPYIWR